MANMMILPILKSAVVIFAKSAIVGLLNSATFAEFSLGDKGTEYHLKIEPLLGNANQLTVPTYYPLQASAALRVFFHSSQRGPPN
jgi:hypothetical protein